VSWSFRAVWLARLLCHCLSAVICELSVNIHRPFILHCSELCSPMSLSPALGLVLSVQHQGLTEQWEEMWRGSDSGSCWNCQVEPLPLPAGAGFAPFGLRCQHFITTPLWQFGTGKVFPREFPWVYHLRDGEDFYPSMGRCRLLHNNFFDRDAFDELG